MACHANVSLGVASFSWYNSAMYKEMSFEAIFQRVARRLGYRMVKIPTNTSGRQYRIENPVSGRFFIVGNKSPGFYPHITRSAAVASGNKLLTQQILKKRGLKTIKTHDCTSLRGISATAFIKHALTHSFDYPLIIKPMRGFQGLGIDVARDRADLKEKAKGLFSRGEGFMLQPILPYTEYRINVIEGKIMCVHSKRAPHIIGDGTKTIGDLLRAKEPAHKNETVIALEHKRLGTSARSVLPEGTRFFTHVIGKPTTEYYETKRFPAALTSWTERVLEAFACKTLGIDLFVPDTLEDVDSFIIIELNTNPGFRYLRTWCNDAKTPELIVERILTTYFKK